MTSDVLGEALARVYGGDSEAMAVQGARYVRALRAFREHFGLGPVTVYHAPGRVNLIGEHTDYNHGYVLPLALDKDVLLIARPRNDDLVRVANIEPGYGLRRYAISGEIPPHPMGDWANYLQGPAQLLEREQGPGLRGMDAIIDGAPPHGVPRGAGLSSSSALLVAMACALVDINGLDLHGPDLADACGRAEWYAGTRGGIMDQFISLLARQGHALFLDCRPSPGGRYTFRHVPIPDGYAVLVVDSGIRHSNTGPMFNRRVAEGRIGVRLLAAGLDREITHLRDVDNIPWANLEPHLPESVSADELRARGIDPDIILDGGASPDTNVFDVRKRCRHVISENQRVLDFVAALEKGDMPRLGGLMAAAHASARDDYGISTPELDLLVELARNIPGAVGARLTGAGWGGCIVALVREDSTDIVRRSVTSGYRERVGLEAHTFVCRSASGAGPVVHTTV